MTYWWMCRVTQSMPIKRTICEHDNSEDDDREGDVLEIIRGRLQLWHQRRPQLWPRKRPGQWTWQSPWLPHLDENIMTTSTLMMKRTTTPKTKPGYNVNNQPDNGLDDKQSSTVVTRLMTTLMMTQAKTQTISWKTIPTTALTVIQGQSGRWL